MISPAIVEGLLGRAAGVAAAALAARLAWSAWTRSALRRLSRRARFDPLLAELPRGQAAVVYFSTRDCAPCRLQQRPALDRLIAATGEAVRLIHVDATGQPQVADRWGVVSAPTTIVLDGSRRPRFINRGVATFATLMRQVESALDGRDS